MAFMQVSDRRVEVASNTPQTVLTTKLASSGNGERAQETLALLQKTK